MHLHFNMSNAVAPLKNELLKVQGCPGIITFGQVYNKKSDTSAIALSLSKHE